MPEHDANADTLRCYRCGTSLLALTLPLSRRDLCPDCSVELHVCRMCRYYAPGKPDDCSEDDAEAVRDKAAANFCEFFTPDPAVFDGREQRAEAGARDRLAALFGEAEPGAAEQAEAVPDIDSALSEAEKLFRN
jgi:hypothetical protein